MAIAQIVASPPRASAPVIVLPARNSRRFTELDILRGFLLLWMTLTHLPTKASVIANQTFGFVSGAEGFIFLAAFMMGYILQRNQQKWGDSGVLHDVLKRTLRIYIYHCALLAIAFTLVAQVALRSHSLALENLLSFYLQSPKHAVIAGALLQYRPSLMDILPMYIVFMLLTPVVRKAAQSLGWKPVLFVSLTIWASAQFGLRAWADRHSDFFGLHVPQSSTGAFDLYGWQLLWIVGLALGSICAKKLSAAPSSAATSDRWMPDWLVNVSLLIAATFLVMRYAPTDHWVDARLYGWLIDKWHLGVARLVNFAAVGLLLVRFGSHLAGLALFKPLASLGKASIQVFSVHVLFCIAGHALSKGADTDLSWLEQSILVGVTIPALFITAHLANKRSSKEPRDIGSPGRGSEARVLALPVR